MVTAIGLLIIIVVVILYLNGGITFLSASQSGVETQLNLRQLWEGAEYSRLANSADSILVDDPLNANALFYGGISHFYTALAISSRQEQLSRLNISIEYLRKLLILSNPPQLPKVYYILAQAYYHKGDFYYDLSINYMTQAINLGYIGEQSYEYLGAAHAKLGNYQESLGYFRNALADGNHSSELLTALAETYYIIEDYTRALESAKMLEEIAYDDSARQRVELLYAKIYIGDRQYDTAEQILTRFLDIHPQSAEGHYQLGELYNAINMPDKARFEWRTAFRLDPSHVEALQSLRSQ